MIEISTQNNRVIESKKMLSQLMTKKEAILSSSSYHEEDKEKEIALPPTPTSPPTTISTSFWDKDTPEPIAPTSASSSSSSSKKPPPSSSRTQSGVLDISSKFLQSNLHWSNIESRTRHLIGMMGKCSSKHNLVTCLDELWSHIYSHSETRSTAVQLGALKVFHSKIV
jgi:hypothetical protein